jgi:hypothetical protein
MDDLNRVLPDELKTSTLWPGNELVLPYAEALRAVGIATEHQIAVLGFEAFKVLKNERNGLQTVDYSGYDVPYVGDWLTYVALTSVEAEHWITRHVYGADHGYILTSASKKEFDQLPRREVARIERKLAFEAAIRNFQELLRKCGYAEKILWLMPEDVLVSGKRFVYVRFPVPASNEARARRTYEEGIAHGRGLLISTLCEVPGATGCFIWYPKNRAEEPQGIWPQDGSFKLSTKIEGSRIPGKVVRSGLQWTLLGVRHAAKQSMKDRLFR